MILFSIMRTNLRNLVLSLFLLFLGNFEFSARAEFYMIQSPIEIEGLLQSHDWVFFDIDDTLMRYQQRRYPYLIDLEVPQFIQEYRSEKVKFLGLTARTADRGLSYLELKSLGVEFDPFCDSEVYFIGKYRTERGRSAHVLCHRGILFTGNEISKGDLLLQFLVYLKNQGQSGPRRIHFVDDRIENILSVQSVEGVLKELGVESLVLFHIQAPR